MTVIQRRWLVALAALILALTGGYIIDNTEMKAVGTVMFVATWLLIVFAPFFTGDVK